MEAREIRVLHFWIKVENHLNSEVPRYIKYLFRVQKLDNHIGISELPVDEVIVELEQFARGDLYAFHVPKGAKREDYYGTATTNEEFQFSIQDKALIAKIFEYVKSVPREEWTEIFKISQGVESLVHSYGADKSEHEPKGLLKLLIKTYKERLQTSEAEFRYDNDLLVFSAYIRIMGGPMLYEILAANLSIPSVSYINKYIRTTTPIIIEGECRIKELKKFLKERNLPLVIWLSEHATRIAENVRYESKTNQMVGFVLPLNSDGMPISKSFYATSAEQMQNTFENQEQASMLYTIMAQPLKLDSPPFCLQFFGTDDAFTAENCISRWDSTIKLLEKEGISVLGISSGGDPRLLKAMDSKMQLGCDGPSRWTFNEHSVEMKEFNACVNNDLMFVQDPLYIGLELRNTLMRYSLFMPIGNFVVSSTHFLLLKQMTQDMDLLTERDLDKGDKMNFDSVLRISNTKIITLLQKYAPGSEGTQTYLKIMDNVLQSFLSPTLSIEERVYKLWHTIFFLRLWRTWLSSSEHYSLMHHCIPASTYKCIEINGHSMIQLIFYCLRQKSFEYFLPWLMSCQPCESFFRLLRSKSTAISTPGNFTVMEAVNLLRKMQLQENILAYKFEDPDIIIPSKKLQPSFEVKTFFNSEISQNIGTSEITVDILMTTIAKAKNDAFNLARDLGIEVDISSSTKCNINLVDCREKPLIPRAKFL